jgi:amino acid transporter
MSLPFEHLIPAPRGGAAARPSRLTETLASGRLGVPAVGYFVMSAAAPLTVIAGAVTTANAVTGVTGMPVAFLVVAVVLAVFSVGYVAMARRISNAGAFYTYVTHGLGRPAGVAAALVAVLAYNALQIALYGGLGVAAAGFFAAEVGWAAPWWAYALATWALVAVLGLLRVDLNGKVLAVLLVTEIAVVLVFDAADLLHPAGGSISLATLSPDNLAAPGLGAALVLAITGFVGFENAAVFSEETKDPRRTVAVATYLAVGLIAALYAGSAWAMSVGAGRDQIVQRSRTEGTETMFTLAAGQLGAGWATAGRVLFLTSLLAALLSFHNTVARYLFALGREHVLPPALGRTSRRTAAPMVASGVQSGLALAVVGLYAIQGWDPLVRLFFWGGMWGGFGVLLLLTGTSVAVAGFFARHRKQRDPDDGRWRTVIAPALAAAGLLVVLVLAVRNFAALLGVETASPLRWQLPACYLLAAAIGGGWALILRARRPAVYEVIGLGANAVAGRAVSSALTGPPARHTDTPSPATGTAS